MTQEIPRGRSEDILLSTIMGEGDSSLRSE